MVKRLKRRSDPLLAEVNRDAEALLDRINAGASTTEDHEALRRMAETVLALRVMSDDDLREFRARVRREKPRSRR
jgi:hypothetical protein